METILQKEPKIAAADECCPEFDPSLWEGKVHTWDGKLFIRQSYRSLWHIPLPGAVEKTISSLWKKASAVGAAPDRDDNLLLAHDPSPWTGEFYLAVTKRVPGADNVALSGTFISKVFEGAYRQVPEFIRKMDQYLAARKKTARRHYLYYAYCPKCAKKFGHNYVAVVSEV